MWCCCISMQAACVARTRGSALAVCIYGRTVAATLRGAAATGLRKVRLACPAHPCAPGHSPLPGGRQRAVRSPLTIALNALLLPTPSMLTWPCCTHGCVGSTSSPAILPQLLGSTLMSSCFPSCCSWTFLRSRQLRTVGASSASPRSAPAASGTAAPSPSPSGAPPLPRIARHHHLSITPLHLS